ncbi:MAG: hypothetical protein AB3N24_09025 [Leisingera sp.]
MFKDQLSEAQVELAAEMAGYVLLRLTRFFSQPDFDDWKEILSGEGGEVNESGAFESLAQFSGLVGALIWANVTAYSRAAQGLEQLGIVIRHKETAFYKVTVLRDKIRQHLLESRTLGAEEFEYMVYAFFGCENQDEWGAASLEGPDGPVASSVVELEPGFAQLCKNAGLIGKAEGQWAWSPLMERCMSPIELEVSVPGFFSRAVSSDWEAKLV